MSCLSRTLVGTGSGAGDGSEPGVGVEATRMAGLAQRTDFRAGSGVSVKSHGGYKTS